MHEPQTDTYRCPAGQQLQKRFVRVEGGKLISVYFNQKACSACPSRPLCTAGKEKRIRRWEHEAVLDEMERRFEAMPDAMAVRRCTVEHVFGTIKGWMGATHFRTRGLTGDQFLLDIEFVRSVDTGSLFDKIALQLKASSAQVGMSEVMRLRSADVFRVHRIEKVPSPVEIAPAPGRDPVSLPALSEAIRAIERQAEADEIIDSLLSAVRRVLGYRNALVLIRDGDRGCLVTTGSIGYERSGLGSEVAGGEGLIGAAAASGQTIKVNDMSRVRRFGEAIGMEVETSEDATRVVTFPQLPMAMSQIAIAMVARGAVTGVLFIESPERLAFREEDEAALEILAAQATSALRGSEQAAAAAQPEQIPPAPRLAADGREIRVVHHRVDDSVFVDGTYIVKGVAGALLRLMLQWHLKDGREVFTNREMRLAIGSRTPEIKDNLETRLLLLRRRLEEKQAPIQIVRIGRGRVRLEARGPLMLDAARE